MDNTHEELERAEHARHAAHEGDQFLTRVSVTIALLAVLAASVASLESLETAASLSEKSDAAILQNKATDQWSFFQAKSIKKNMYQIAGATDGPHAEEFIATAKRNDDESVQIQTDATNLSKEVEAKILAADSHEHRHQILTVAATLLHIGIAIATVSIIVRGTRWPWFGALALGIAGLLATGFAYV